MATTRTFNDMLNEYLTYDLLKEEFVKRDYLLNKVEKDNGWKGGNLVVPFKAAGASSVSFGSLTAQADVAQDSYVRGNVSAQKEVWGTMIFNQRDLMEHDGSIPEKTFLRILPDAVEDFMDYMKMAVSVNLLNGAHFATMTADNADLATGVITVDRPDRFVIGQYVLVADSGSAAVLGKVSAIDMNTAFVTLTTTAGANLNLSAFAVAQVARCFHPGIIAVGQNTGTLAGTSFTSLRQQLLSLANGGDTNLFGVAKTSAPYLQAINVDGSAITATTILSGIFDALVTIRQRGQGNPTDVVMSYKHLGEVLKALENSKGAFNVVPQSQKTSVYGWTEIEVGSVTKGSLKLVGVQELDDDVIMFIDWRALKFHSNGFFRKRTAPDGKQYYEVRATSGYQYLLDICLFGELVCSKPRFCGILHSIDT